MSHIRLLVIPTGENKDVDGRGLSDDWLLADLGYGEDGDTGAMYYLTTDSMRCSDVANLSELDLPHFGNLLVELLNNHLSSGKKELK